MTSVNSYFTFEYVQPSEYHFSHDSVFLARQAFEEITKQPAIVSRGLDLCAGCGIVGLDFLFHWSQKFKTEIPNFDFIEVQEVYRPFFELNSAKLLNIERRNFISANYNSLLNKDFFEKYDLILCNPPYFRLEQGKLSPSDFKNRCRFFVDSDFETLIKSIQHLLAPKGHCFLLLRDLAEHGVNPLQELENILPANFKLECLPDIRGTGFVKIEKLC